MTKLAGCLLATHNLILFQYHEPLGDQEQTLVFPTSLGKHTEASVFQRCYQEALCHSPIPTPGL